MAHDECECGHPLKQHYWTLTDEPVPKGRCTTQDCACPTFRARSIDQSREPEGSAA